jgi:hypothetical protein
MSGLTSSTDYNIQINSPVSSNGSFFFERSRYGMPFYKKKITVALPLDDLSLACAHAKEAAERIKAVTGQTPNESQQPLYPWVHTGMITKKQQIRRNTLSNDELVAAFLEAELCLNALREKDTMPPLELKEFEKNYHVISSHLSDRFGAEKLSTITTGLHQVYKNTLVD